VGSKWTRRELNCVDDIPSTPREFFGKGPCFFAVVLISYTLTFLSARIGERLPD
jgi:hypothetical protein